MNFTSLEELKKRVMPALRKRASDFKVLGLNITEDDIWFYLKQHKWMKSTNLSLNEIVNDILKFDKDELYNK